MYAVIETGGKQYYIRQGSKILVEKLAGEPGQEIELDKVLMIGGEECRIGSPYVEGALVKAQVAAQGRRPKVVVFKRRRRKDSKCRHGHRQECTTLLISSINA